MVTAGEDIRPPTVVLTSFESTWTDGTRGLPNRSSVRRAAALPVDDISSERTPITAPRASTTGRPETRLFARIAAASFSALSGPTVITVVVIRSPIFIIYLPREHSIDCLNPSTARLLSLSSSYAQCSPRHPIRTSVRPPNLLRLCHSGGRWLSRRDPSSGQRTTPSAQASARCAGTWRAHSSAQIASTS